LVLALRGCGVVGFVHLGLLDLIESFNTKGPRLRPFSFSS
jgi:hypothetical protein